MLHWGRRLLAQHPDAAKRIHLFCERLPSPHLPTAAYDAVVSNSLLHHLREPQVLWEALRLCARPNAVVLIMDLVRPDSEAAADALVAQYAAEAPEVLRQDFRNSLFAAYSIAEVHQQLNQASLVELEVARVSDRHMIVHGRLGGERNA